MAGAFAGIAPRSRQELERSHYQIDTCLIFNPTISEVGAIHAFRSVPPANSAVIRRRVPFPIIPDWQAENRCLASRPSMSDKNEFHFTGICGTDFITRHPVLYFC
jgi:hypothetical protein